MEKVDKKFNMAVHVQRLYISFLSKVTRRFVISRRKVLGVILRRAVLCHESKITFDVSSDTVFSLFVCWSRFLLHSVTVGALNLDFAQTSQILMDGKLMRRILSLTPAFLALLQKGKLLPTSFRVLQQ